AYKSFVSAKDRFLKADIKAKAHQSWEDNAKDVMGSRGANWDWERTMAAMIYAYQMGFIYINIKGRGTKGIVSRGKEYDALLQNLTSRFKALQNQRTGQKLLHDVVRCQDIYPSAAYEVFIPDLVLVPEDGYGFSFSLGPDRLESFDEGTHRQNGV